LWFQEFIPLPFEKGKKVGWNLWNQKVEKTWKGGNSMPYIGNMKHPTLKPRESFAKIANLGLNILTNTQTSQKS